MKIKKFTVASMQEAALLIRKELGNEAVILNSKKINKRKWFGLIKKPAVEVIAVLDQDFLEKKTAEKAKRAETNVKITCQQSENRGEDNPSNACSI